MTQGRSQGPEGPRPRPPAGVEIGKPAIGWVCGLLAILSAFGPADQAAGQSAERKKEVRVTGPGGRTIERGVESQRGPGYASGRVFSQGPNVSRDRSFQIERSPGSVTRSFEAQRSVSGRGAPRSPGTSVLVERRVDLRGPVVIPSRSRDNSAANLAIGLGLGAVGGALLSSALRPDSPPPPPVYVPAPAPLYVPGPPPFGYGVPVSPAPWPPPGSIEAIAPPLNRADKVELQFRDAFGRLGSKHDNSRRDGAYTLGRLGDRRAVPSLIDLLRNDPDTDVRIAAARALGMLADPRSYTPLEQAAQRDPRSKVRETATIVLRNWRWDEPEPPLDAETQPAGGRRIGEIPPPPDLRRPRP